jgi:hypothetical protein
MYSSNEKFEIANTIMQQLGGRRFITMTGANGFSYNVSLKNNVFIAFKVPNRSGANFVTIELTPDDVYTMKFVRIHGGNTKTIAEVEGVYADMLQDVFTQNTGLATHF